jgi:hypothetical protein
MAVDTASIESPSRDTRKGPPLKGMIVAENNHVALGG